MKTDIGTTTMEEYWKEQSGRLNDALPLLHQAHKLLRLIKDIQDDGRHSDYGEECPFCMGELIEGKETQLINDIGAFLNS